MKDLAKYTNLSLGTISKYINGGTVKPKNKQLIDEAIKELGFQVNQFARSLKTNRSNTIGIIIPSMENYFCTSLVSYVEKYISVYGYSVMICNYQEKEKKEREQINFLVSKQVDAIVIVSTCSIETQKLIKEVIQKGTYVVSVDRKLDKIECDTVAVDNCSISKKVTEYLIENGHQKIAVVCGPRKISTASERLQGYIEAFNSYGIPVYQDYIVYGDYYSQSGYKQAMKLLELEEPPTAIFATNYDMTLGVIKALNQKKLQIAKDISVVGFDNLSIAEIIQPTLTIVTQPMKTLAKKAAELIVKRIDKKEELSFPCNITLQAKLIMGNSVKNISSFL